LIDGPAVLRAASLRGILDDELFVDGVHPTLRSYVRLAQAVVDSLRSRRAWNWPGETDSPAIDLAEVAVRAGVDAAKWAEVCHGSAGYYLKVATLRYDQADRQAKALRYEAAARRIKSGARPEDVGIPGIGLGMRAYNAED
jgi:hypothetical protein